MRRMDLIAAGAVVSTGMMLATSALAGGFAIREQSTTGLGSAFAGSAAGGDLSSMYWNPAAVTALDGMNSASSYTLIMPDTNIDVTAANRFGATGTDIDTVGFLGSSYLNYQLTNQLYVGLSLNSPLGLVTEADNRLWSGATYNRKSEILSLNAAPTIGYKIMPNLSLAAGVQIEYLKARLASGFAGNFAGSDVVIKGDDIAVGFTAGVLYEPLAGTRIGIGYRSSIEHALDGTLHGMPPVPPVAALNGAVTAQIDTPDMVTVSLSQKVTSGLTLMANYEWSNWSNLQTLEVKRKGIPASIVETYSWKDSWLASVGGELAISDSLTGRAGIAFEKSPVPDETRAARLPDSDRIWLSVGGSYKWSEATLIDFGYSHIFFDDSKIDLAADLATGKPGLKADVSNSADIVSAGMRIKW